MVENRKLLRKKLIESFDKLNSRVVKRSWRVEVKLEQVDSHSTAIERGFETVRQEHALLELKLMRIRQSLICNVILYMHQATSECNNLSGQVDAIAVCIRETNIRMGIDYSII